MAFWSNWSDGTKWVMGIVGALIVAGLIGIVRILMITNAGSPTGKAGSAAAQPREEDSLEEVVSAPIAEPEVQGSGEETENQHQRSDRLESPPNPITPQPVPVANTDPRSQNSQGFTFLLERCAAEGEDVNCWILVTNNLGSRKLSVFVDGSWLKDQSDNKHEVRRALGSDGSREFNILRLDLPSQSPERFGLHFFGVAPVVSSVKFLNLNTRDFDVGWRGVPVE